MDRKSKKYVLSVAVLSVLLSVVLAGNSIVSSQRQPEIDRQDFRDSMRELWDDHSELTRLFIISVASNMPDQTEATQKLIRKQNEIGAVLASFYGNDVGDQLAGLLNEHTQITAALLRAAREADAPAFEETVARWYDNAEAIAQFLHNTNEENWPLRKIRPMMRVYLDLTLEQAVARWNSDFAKEAAAYEKVQDQALDIADLLSQGIINKFRHRFK